MARNLAQRRELIHRAAFLLREAIGRSVSQRFREEEASAGNKNIEIPVFDTDIIKCYCSPWTVGPLAAQGRQGYGQILPRTPHSSTLGRRLSKQRLKVIRENLEFENSRATKIAEMLASAAINETKTLDIPIVQLPSHARETDTVFKRVNEAARNKPGTGRDDAKTSKWRETFFLKRLLAVLLNLENSDLGDEDKVALRLSEEISKRWEDSRRTGLSSVKRESLNHLELNNKYGMTSLSNFKLSKDTLAPRIGGEKRFNALLEALGAVDNRTPTEQLAFEVLTRMWSDRLTFSKTQQRTESHVLDVEALVYLSLANKRLADGNTGIRLVLISGDRNLVETAYDNFEGLDKHISEAVPDSGKSGITRKDLRAYFGLDVLPDPMLSSSQLMYEWEVAKLRDDPKNHDNQALNFSLNYVRHLWAFADEVLFNPVDPDHDPERDEFANSPPTESLRKFFSGLLADHTEWNEISQGPLEEIVRRKGASRREHSHKDIVIEALEKFDWLTKKSIEKYDVKAIEGKQLLKNKVLEIVNRHREQRHFNWKDMISEIDDWHQRIQNQTISALSHIGAEILFDQKAIRTRNPPDLIFDGLENTNQALALLSRKNLFKRTTRRFASVYDDIKNDSAASDTDDRSLTYLKFMILAAAFSSANKWYVADIHAQNAIRIVSSAADRGEKIVIHQNNRVNTNTPEATSISGREAYFLSSVCVRIMAERPTDYDEAARRLGLAENALKSENVPVPLKQHVVFRFANERLALTLSRYYYQRHREESDYCDELAADICKDYLALMNVCGLENKQFNKETEFLPHARKTSRDAIAANIVQVAVILMYRDKMRRPSVLKEVDAGILYVAVRTLYENFQDIDGNHETELMRYYRKIGAMITEFPDPKLPKSSDQIEEMFQNAPDSAIMAYDSWRFERLKEFALELVAV